jgi:membrane protein
VILYLNFPVGIMVAIGKVKGKRMKAWFRNMFDVLKQATVEFVDDDALKLSASLAFYTIFSIGPFLMVIIASMSWFYDESMITSRVFENLGMLLGGSGATQLRSILDNINLQNNSTIFGIIGVITLLFGATGIFTEIQGSINYIWSIKAKPQKSWLKFIADRLLSFSLIIVFGFLMIVTLLLDLLLDVMWKKLGAFIGHNQTILIKIANQGVLLAVVVLLFAIIFKVLPDARISWKDALRGATFSGILFLIGKFLISFYIARSSITVTYGAAASSIILLSWVYYAAIILYFGAEFTEVYAMKLGEGMTVAKTAVFIVKQEEEELPQQKRMPSERQKKENGSSKN